jgi:hypothetical protein
VRPSFFKPPDLSACLPVPLYPKAHRMPLLRPILLAIVLTLLAGWECLAQDHRFLYLQTDDGQPFYVRKDGAIHSSTLSGFLILSRLQDTAVDLVFGFPRDLYPGQRFRVSPIDRDRGMVLKRQEEGRWILFDLQSMETFPGDEIVKDAPVARPSRQQATNDSFTTMLSTAIGDSSLLESRVAGEKPVDQAVAKAPSAASSSDTGLVKPSPVYAAPDSSSSSPLSASVPSDSLRSRSEIRPAASLDTMGAMAPVNPSLDSVKAVGDAAAAAAPAASGSAGKGDEPVPAAKADRTDCKSSQSVAQLGDLRRRMEAMRDEEAQVAEAVREMRLRCFSSAQVRSLLVVFGREEGRFKMMSAAYPLVRDPSAYPDLLPILKDPYFIHRFKRMTGMPMD